MYRKLYSIGTKLKKVTKYLYIIKTLKKRKEKETMLLVLVPYAYGIVPTALRLVPFTA